MSFLIIINYTSGGAIDPLFLTNRDKGDCDEIEKS